MRSVALLLAADPLPFDLQRLVSFDHLVVHTGDVGGPTSLHAAVPMRTAELLVRRGIVERGLMLMISRGLIERETNSSGIVYSAGEFAETFFNSLTSEYAQELAERAEWVVENFGSLSEEDLKRTVNLHFDQWIEQFQAKQPSVAGDS